VKQADLMRDGPARSQAAAKVAAAAAVRAWQILLTTSYDAVQIK
jgi:hypothetical protein